MSPLQDKLPVGIEAVIDNIDTPRQSPQSGRPDEAWRLGKRSECGPLRSRSVTAACGPVPALAGLRWQRVIHQHADCAPNSLCRCRTDLLTGRFG